MRTITKKRLLEAAEQHANARSKIAFWFHAATAAVWSNLTETRKTFPHADQVTVKSGRIVTVFNVTDRYRLITAIHYNRKKIFILQFLTHADYAKGKWKNNL